MNTLDCATMLVETLIKRDRKYGGRANYKSKFMNHAMIYVPGFSDNVKARRYLDASRKIQMVGRVWDLLRCANITITVHVVRPHNGWVYMLQLQHFCLYNMGTVQRMAHIKKHLLSYMEEQEKQHMYLIANLEQSIFH